MNNKRIGAALLAAGLMIGTVGIASSATAETVYLEPSVNEGVCGPLDSGKIDTTGDPATVTMTAPAGSLITGYCIKAGSEQSGGGPVYIDVEPPKASITVGHPSGKDVSHYSFEWETPNETTTTTEPEEEPEFEYVVACGKFEEARFLFVSWTYGDASERETVPLRANQQPGDTVSVDIGEPYNDTIPVVIPDDEACRTTTTTTTVPETTTTVVETTTTTVPDVTTTVPDVTTTVVDATTTTEPVIVTTVPDEPTTTTPNTLPKTGPGDSTGNMALMAFGMLLAGLGITFLTRRKDVELV